jgi:translocation and assembly module TamB
LKTLRVLGWLLVIPLLLIATVLVALWSWAGADSSLASALQRASAYLPAGQTLVVEGARGSLRQGGHIDLLRWEKEGLTVEAHQIDLAWAPAALLDRRLQLDRIHVAQLIISDQRPASTRTPPQSLALPFEVDLNFVVDALRWNGPSALDATALSGHYRFSSDKHRLDGGSAHIADGTYRAQASLAAASPLALDLQLQGDLKTAVPGSTQALALTASASVRGRLSGPDPKLEFQAQLQPATQVVPALTAPTAVSRQVQATVAAQINPWAAQPIIKADAAFTELNLSMLWPDAPQTRLTGNVQVQPRPASSPPAPGDAIGPAWQARGRFTNLLSGPWDQQRLPLESAEAELNFQNGQWSLQSLTAAIAGGRLQAQGKLSGAEAHAATPATALSGWQGQATLQNVNPAALHSKLAAARMDGQLNATAVRQGIDFDVLLKPSPRQPPASQLKGLRLKSALAKGRWADGTLSLATLQLQTDDALLQGQLEVQPTSKAVGGQLHLSLPGGQADIAGKLSAQAGAGNFALRMTDATRASRWLAALPGAPAALAHKQFQGNGELSGSWQGGWQGLGTGQLSLNSTLLVPMLDMRSEGQTPAQALRVRDLAVQLTGRVNALALKLDGKLLSGTRSFQLQTQATAGRRANGDWQGQVGQATLKTEDSLRPGTWTLQTRQAVAMEWKPALAGGALEASAGEATVAGPLSGIATVAWQPIRWSSRGLHGELKTQGQIKGLPMDWLTWFSNTQLVQTGLSGNLVFDGDWDVLAADTLKAKASLVRRSGDMRLQAADNQALPGLADGKGTGIDAGKGFGIDAGVKDARLTLTTDGDALHVALRWDSERAGQAQVDFSTRVSTGAAGQGWQWSDDAPLVGSLRAQLPQVGVWSVLAPPGWRIRGTVDAKLQLSGTRRLPQWHGTLDADQLALRSVADGIEFSQGKLSSTLDGQRLNINAFSLHGAGGGNGGLLTGTGFALWAPDGSAAASGLSGIQVELNAKAQALRLSARSDRRLVVSGELQAKLVDARLTLRGALKADQALLILPDENTPSLGRDVVVKSAVTGAGTGTASATTAVSATAGTRIVPDVAITLDMGNDFRVQGRGLNTRLAGSLKLVALGAGATPILTGELSTVRGSYKAYGQQLDIEEGAMRFTGAYDNPALDILAIRPNLAVRVGVQISGTALSPRVRLYADPELPEAEKLAWLVLGRSAANGGAESAVLQQAALALLGGSGKGLTGGLVGALGIDELSFRGSASNTDGTTTAATVTVGKRLSREFYVAFERSLAGTLGTVYIFYDLSKRFTLRAQSGDQSAVDLIFTLPYD